MTDKKLQIRNSTAEFLALTAQPGQQSFEVYMPSEVIPSNLPEIPGVQMETDCGVRKKSDTIRPAGRNGQR